MHKKIIVCIENIVPFMKFRSTGLLMTFPFTMQQSYKWLNVFVKPDSCPPKNKNPGMLHESCSPTDAEFQ